MNFFGFNKNEKKGTGFELDQSSSNGKVSVIAERSDDYKESWSSRRNRAVMIHNNKTDGFEVKSFYDENPRFGGVWKSDLTTADSDIADNLNKYKQQSRTEYQQNSILFTAIEIFDNNIIGPDGFNLKFTIKNRKGEFDHELSKVIIKEFKEWSKAKNCDVKGQSSLRDITFECLKNLEIDGEMLVKQVTEKSNKYNAYGYQLQSLDTARLDVQQSGRNTDNNNTIRMGIEFNERGRPVAYHVKKKANIPYNYDYYNANDFEIIDAEDIIFKFYPKFSEQTRGFPTNHSILGKLKNLKELERTVTQTFKLAASATMVIKLPEDQEADSVATGKDEQDNFVYDLTPGTGMVLPPGAEIDSFEPKCPDAIYAPFIKKTEQEISGVLGLSPVTLMKNLEDVNYSTARVLLLEERTMYRKKQNFLIENFLNVVFERWLEVAILNGKISYNGQVINDLSTFGEHEYEFTGRRWEWIDPKKEIEAKRIAFGLGVTTLSDILAEQGDNIHDLKSKNDLDREVLGDDYFFKIFNSANNIQGDSATTLTEDDE